MDLSKISHSAKLVVGGGILFLIVSFFNWQEVTIGPISVGATMWHGWGVLAGLVVIGLLVWEGLQLSSISVQVGSYSPQMVTAGIAGLLVVSTVLKVLVDSDFRTIWAWIGLIFAIVVGLGAWRGLTATSE